MDQDVPEIGLQANSSFEQTHLSIILVHLSPAKEVRIAIITQPTISFPNQYNLFKTSAEILDLVWASLGTSCGNKASTGSEEQLPLHDITPSTEPQRKFNIQHAVPALTTLGEARRSV
ncbi:MAG: hypothetical protein L6R41_003373 [Letrouitia leprolyta]|nr:MAG: hypothetical protein L6R41_003373 [Letrouitia leprolyta]